MFIFKFPLLRWIPLPVFALVLGTAVGLVAGCTTQNIPKTSNGLLGKSLPADAEPLDQQPVQDGAKREWISPSGLRIVDGFVDAEGYVLPLDIRRPKPDRPEGERPSALRIDALRRLAKGGPFAETRISPDDGHTQNETSIDADILSVRSTDGGMTWSSPIRVNDDGSGRSQFFPWITFGDDGLAHAVWYDQRLDGSNIDVYMATSSDAGASWGPNVRVTAEAFTPVLPWEGGAASFIGDYNGIAAAGGYVYPLYQDSREGNQDVWVSAIPSSSVFVDGFESGDVTLWTSAIP